jgi:hypothetical protein
VIEQEVITGYIMGMWTVLMWMSIDMHYRFKKLFSKFRSEEE